jgi:predicted transcriptional regulator
MEKTATFTMRVQPDLKKAFDEAAKSNDRSSALLIRDFMREYVKKNAQGNLFGAKK